MTNRIARNALVLIAAGALVAAGAFAVEAGYGKKSAARDIVDTAVAAGDFGTLVKAVEAAGLVDVLKGDGPFTVFAPTDAAFASLPAGTLESLLADKEALTSVLTYHVVPGRLMAEDVVSKRKLSTVQGKEIAVNTGSDVKVDKANVVKTDIECSNGIIHVIDAVITP